MTKFSALASNVAVAPQIGDADFSTIAALGFKSVLNLRPDDETGEFLKSGDAGRVAEAFGLDYRYMPVHCHCITDEEQVEGFAEAIAELPGPVFAYCKSGTRAAILWALSIAGSRPTEEIVRIAAVGGYDISLALDDIEERAGETAGLISSCESHIAA